MKKILALMLALTLVLSFSLVSCDELFDEALFDEGLFEEDEENRDDDDDDNDDFYNSDNDESLENGGDKEIYTGDYNGGSLVSGSNGTANEEGESIVIRPGFGGNGSGSIGIATDTTTDQTEVEDEFTSATEDGETEAVEIPNDRNIVEKYNAAVERLSKVNNITLTTVQEIDMVMNYGTISIPQTVAQNIVQKYAGDDFSIVAQAVSMGQAVPSTNTQYVGGTVYNVQTSDGQKIKYQATKAELEALLGIDSDGARIYDIPEDWFKEATVYRTGNKYYVVILLDGEQYREMFSDLTLLSNTEEISDICHTIYFDENDDIESVVTTATMKMNISGIDTTASFVATSVYSNVGNTTVEAPADADSYTLVDISQLQ